MQKRGVTRSLVRAVAGSGNMWFTTALFSGGKCDRQIKGGRSVERKGVISKSKPELRTYTTHMKSRVDFDMSWFGSLSKFSHPSELFLEVTISSAKWALFSPRPPSWEQFATAARDETLLFPPQTMNLSAFEGKEGGGGERVGPPWESTPPSHPACV